MSTRTVCDHCGKPLADRGLRLVVREERFSPMWLDGLGPWDFCDAEHLALHLAERVCIRDQAAGTYAPLTVASR